MVSKRKKTGFDKYFDEQMRDDEFREGYEKIRQEIGAVDALVRALDAARIDVGVSKAQLAREIAAEPAVVRRLFTAKRPNPTLATFAKLAEALGYELRLTPKDPASSKATGKGKKKATRKKHSAGECDVDSALAS